MIVENILILYTSNPDCPQLRTTVQLIEASGRQVYLRPLSQLRQQKKAVITPAIHSSLSTLHPN